MSIAYFRTPAEARHAMARYDGRAILSPPNHDRSSWALEMLPCPSGETMRDFSPVEELEFLALQCAVQAAKGGSEQDAMFLSNLAHAGRKIAASETNFFEVLGTNSARRDPHKTIKLASFALQHLARISRTFQPQP